MCYHKGLVSIKKKKEEEPTADIIPVLITPVNNLTHDACSKQNLYCQWTVLMGKRPLKFNREAHDSSYNNNLYVAQHN